MDKPLQGGASPAQRHSDKTGLRRPRTGVAAGHSALRTESADPPCSAARGRGQQTRQRAPWTRFSRDLPRNRAQSMGFKQSCLQSRKKKSKPKVSSPHDRVINPVPHMQATPLTGSVNAHLSMANATSLPAGLLCPSWVSQSQHCWWTVNRGAGRKGCSHGTKRQGWRPGGGYAHLRAPLHAGGGGQQRRQASKPRQNVTTLETKDQGSQAACPLLHPTLAHLTLHRLVLRGKRYFSLPHNLPTPSRQHSHR